MVGVEVEFYARALCMPLAKRSPPRPRSSSDCMVKKGWAGESWAWGLCRILGGNIYKRYVLEEYLKPQNRYIGEEGIDGFYCPKKNLVEWSEWIE